MPRNGLLIAAGLVLVLALFAASTFSNRGLPEPSETAPENITRPSGDPPPMTTAPDTPPGRTFAPPDTSRSGR